MKVTIEPKEAEQIKEALTIQIKVLTEQLEAIQFRERERLKLKAELQLIKMESGENPYVIVRDHYEEKKAKYLTMIEDCSTLELKRKIDNVERLAAKYDYLLNGPKHKGRFPNRTKQLIRYC
jgi:hypothetical protein